METKMPAENINGKNDLTKSSTFEGILMISIFLAGFLLCYFWPPFLAIFFIAFFVSFSIAFFLPRNSFFWILSLLFSFDLLLGAVIQTILFFIIKLFMGQ